MKTGLMNNPRSDLAAEIDFAATNEFDFLEITLEYPEAHLDVINRGEVLRLLQQSGLTVLGHTSWYLPSASPISSLREAAIGDVVGCLEFFKEAGAEIVTVHPDNGPGQLELGTRISLNALSFKIISDEAAKYDLTIAVENVPGVFSSVEALDSIFKSVPGLGFVLDVGHAFIRRNRFRHLLAAFKDKLRHVHVSDNRLHEDDHIPLGAGKIIWEDVVGAIKKTGYDSTFTLEIFSSDRRYIMASRDKLRELWSSC
jgi:sugar phosphate isomerase/epimerase